MTLIRSAYTPEQFEVREGDRVTLKITNVETIRDMTHGFALPDHNLQLDGSSRNRFVANRFAYNDTAVVLFSSAEAYLFVQPVSRGEVLVGRWLGEGAALGIALLIGFGAGAASVTLNAGPADLPRFAVLIGVTAALALAFLSLAALIAASVQRRAAAGEAWNRLLGGPATAAIAAASGLALWIAVRSQ